MDEYHTDKKYESLKIPDRHQVTDDGATQSLSPTKVTPTGSLSEGMYYEIDYDSYPIPGAGKFVLKSQKIEPVAPSENDEIRELFHQMRDISRTYRSSSHFSSNFLDRRVQQDHATIFYKQGMFMKDFSDNYSGNVQFSQYFPYYQLMNYEQLRTYFTWRSAVRNGNVTDTSLSYAFLYIYELLGNIGVSSPQDGLDKLMSFWKAFHVYNMTIDKYVIRWLKDYHVYYELPQSFKEFITENHLAMNYPKVPDNDDNFDLFCAISKYDIRKSAFFTDNKVKMVTDCFYYVIDKLRQVFIDNGIHFDDSIFEPAKGMTVWMPFKGALFTPWIKQTDRRIILSENEIYLCSQNKWAFNTVITTESGKEFIGYIMKQMEAVLRKATQFKYKLSANINMVTHTVIGKLNEKGLSLENIVTNTVTEFYREATKTVVKVDHQALSNIRKEALVTQEKLFVPEQEVQIFSIPAPQNMSFAMPQNMPPIPTLENEQASATTIWADFKNTLSETELQALSVLLHEKTAILSHEKTDIKKFANSCGIMLEVLADGINEKAMDTIGDNLMDDEFVLYDDYKDQIRKLIE